MSNPISITQRNAVIEANIALGGFTPASLGGDLDWWVDPADDSYFLYNTATDIGLAQDKNQLLARTAEYTSDFSAGVDGWSDSGTVLTGNQDGVGGEDDALNMSITTSGGGQKRMQYDDFFDARYFQRLTFRYYMPSTNTVVDSLVIRSTGSSGTTTIETINPATLDTWVTVTIEFYQIQEGQPNIRIQLADGGSLGFSSAAGDQCYFKDIEISTYDGVHFGETDTGADLEHDQGNDKIIGVNGDRITTQRDGAQYWGGSELWGRVEVQSGANDSIFLSREEDGNESNNFVRFGFKVSGSDVVFFYQKKFGSGDTTLEVQTTNTFAKSSKYTVRWYLDATAIHIEVDGTDETLSTISGTNNAGDFMELVAELSPPGEMFSYLLDGALGGFGGDCDCHGIAATAALSGDNLTDMRNYFDAL